MLFIDRLIERVKEKNNPTVMGLDPKLEYIPVHIREKNMQIYGKTLRAVSKSIIEFNIELIDSVSDIIAVVKPQLAYYEMYGLEGLTAFYETIRYAKEKGFLVLADGKRNDIGSTATAYSSAYLGKTKLDDKTLVPIFDVDALTVNPYLGSDGIVPFIDDCREYGKGIFILVKTSNPSSGELQDVVTDENVQVFELVSRYVRKWGSGLVGKSGYSSVGAVVGATYPQQLKKAREMMPKSYILVPGYGAQGGTAEDVAGAFDKNGLGALINASRSLMCAYRSERWNKTFSSKEFAKACRAEALRMRNDILAALN